MRTLSLCTCRRTTPVQRTGALVAQACPSVSAFPETTIGSVCTSSFSRIARRSFTLRPAHSRGHQNRDRYPKASDISSPPCLLRLLPAGAKRRVGLAPTGKRRLVTAKRPILYCARSISYGTISNFGQYGRDIWRRRCASCRRRCRPTLLAAQRASEAAASDLAGEVTDRLRGAIHHRPRLRTVRINVFEPPGAGPPSQPRQFGVSSALRVGG